MILPFSGIVQSPGLPLPQLCQHYLLAWLVFHYPNGLDTCSKAGTVHDSSLWLQLGRTQGQAQQGYSLMFAAWVNERMFSSPPVLLQL